MKLKPFALFLCIIALILAALSPFAVRFLYPELHEYKPFKGILTMWNIAGWRTGGSSVSTYLKKRASEYEARNPYIFIEVEDMSQSEAEEAISNGEYPDFISFPYGFQPTLDLISLPNADFLIPEISDNAYPFMCGGYCALVNTDMLEAQGLFPPSGWGILPEELLSFSQLGICFDSEEGCTSLPAIVMHEYSKSEGPNISTWGEPKPPEAALSLPIVSYENGLKDFCSGKYGVLIASHRQLFEAERLFEENECPAFSAYALSGYTDMVQLAGVVSSANEKKQEACEEFVTYLISDSVQKKLEALGVFPAVDNIDIYEENACRFYMYQLLAENASIAPFGEKQSLESLAKEVFGGNEAAIELLKHLLIT